MHYTGPRISARDLHCRRAQYITDLIFLPPPHVQEEEIQLRKINSRSSLNIDVPVPRQRHPTTGYLEPRVANQTFSSVLH